MALQLQKISKNNGSLHEIDEAKMRRLALVVRDSNDAVTISDFEGRITAWNRGAELMYGYSEKDALQMSIWQITPPAKVEEKKEFVRRLIAGEAVPSFESQRVTKDGRILDIWMTVTKLVDDTGKPIGIASTERDITGRWQAKKLLVDSETRYRRLFETAKDGILILDAVTGLVADVNPFLIDLLGYSKEQFLGMHLWEVGAFKDILASEEAFLELKEKEYIRYEDLPLKTVGGRLINVEFVSNVYLVNGKKVIQCNIRDISERKRLEKEKEHLQSQLLQAQKMEAVGTLAGGVAHDFNNLLTVISGFTTLAMMKIDESNPMYMDLQQVNNAAARATIVIRQLLLFSRKQHMEPVPMDPNNAISHLLKMLGRLIGEDIVIDTNLGKGLWSILGDEGNIEQVLMNLSVNARDAMPSGGKLFIKTENITIDDEYCRGCNGGRPGRFVCISVSDTGTGMDKQTLDHIFEPFFTTKPEGKGTGLGLSVVFGIVNQHKGWINVYSEPGHGTTFKAYFPSSSARPEQKSKGEVSIASLKGKGERIMVVEDQTEVRELAKEMLTTNGYSVFPVSTAKKAMELFENENGRFDLVFSDVVLTDTTGVLLVEGLLKRGKFGVIITSGYTDEKANWDLIQEKKHRFLHKPYTMHDLLLAVKEVLAEKKKLAVGASPYPQGYEG